MSLNLLKITPHAITLAKRAAQAECRRYQKGANMDAYQTLIKVIHHSAIPIVDSLSTYDELLDKIGDARFVLIGEASHGTREFYQARIDITKELIEKKGFMAVMIEGDWPEAYRVHRYLKGHGGVLQSTQALDGFNRFPTWMWKNTTLPPFLQWLRTYNDSIPAATNKIGFYGLDLYSLNASMQAVIAYLSKVDPLAAEHAKHQYACFDHLNLDPQIYGYLTSAGIKKSCMDEAIAELCKLQQHAFDYIKQDGIAAEDEYFFAVQNARVVKNAEQYYRSMYRGQASSWNVRDTHMAETVTTLVEHLEQQCNKPAKIIIWAHNSHVGDARATEMSDRGEINIGQLMREQYTDTYSIGFSTYEGFVTAATDWDNPALCRKIVPGFSESYEEVFHHVPYEGFILNLVNDETLDHYLKIPRLQRAIGVIYRPETERFSHYYFTHLPDQFDSIIHLDKTNAVRPLMINKEWQC
jgi:erythromycin esterase-like protein